MSLEYETILADPALKEPYVNNPGPTARGRQPHHDCQLRQELNNSSTLFNVSTLQRFILPFKCAFRDRRRVTFGEPLGGFPATPKTPNSLHSLGFCFKSGLNKTSFVRPSLKQKSSAKRRRKSLSLRREGDSNPRSRGSGTTVFETAAFDHSAISPSVLRSFGVGGPSISSVITLLQTRGTCIYLYLCPP